MFEDKDLHLDVLASPAKPNRPPAVPASTQPMNTRHVSVLPLGTGEVAARLWEAEDLQAGSLCGLAARDFRHSGQPCPRPHEPSGADCWDLFVRHGDPAGGLSDGIFA